MATYTFSERDGRYRDAAGRYVSEARVRAVVDAIADHASDRLRAASERLLAGDLSLASWQAEAMQIIRTSHVAASVLAQGGAAQMTPSRWGSIGPAVRDQYAYLRQFAAQVASGEQALNGSLTARAQQYGQAARVQYETTYNRGQQERGYRYERNVLGSAEHCRLCPELTARGWVPIGTLPPVGSRPCRSNDRCRLAYARSIEQEVAA